MDLLSGIFVLSVVILVLVGILLGFVICNSITRERRDRGQRGGDNTNETQLDRMERKLDALEGKLDRGSKFTWSSSLYMLGVTAMGVGIGLITRGFCNTGSIVLLVVGLVIAVGGLFFLFRYGRFARR
jgi:hypothetical protein